MNKCIFIGNLTRDPELRVTANQVSVCNFTLAVNRRGSETTDYVRVTAWRGLGENCQKYLTKGKKACVVGVVGVESYEGHDGNTYASLTLTAEDVEFLSPRDEPDRT